MVTILDSNYINEYIIERCNSKGKADKGSKQYAYAKDHASFLKIIKTCEDIDRLQEIRNHIIAEIMQAGQFRVRAWQQQCARQQYHFQIRLFERAD